MEAVTLSLGKNTMRWMKINSLKKKKKIRIVFLFAFFRSAESNKSCKDGECQIYLFF